jgi:hypothetical protein
MTAKAIDLHYQAGWLTIAHVECLAPDRAMLTNNNHDRCWFAAHELYSLIKLLLLMCCYQVTAYLCVPTSEVMHGMDASYH